MKAILAGVALSAPGTALAADPLARSSTVFVEKNITPNRVFDKPFPLDESGDPGYKWPKKEKIRGKKKASRI